jgi:RNA polymerase-binding transcription factor DksA
MGRNGNERLAEFRRMLLGRRADLAAGLGIRFDTLARLGRVAEEDQAPITHEEFISLRRNNMDYEQWRLIEEALRRLNTGSYGRTTCRSRNQRRKLGNGDRKAFPAADERRWTPMGVKGLSACGS